MDERIIKKMKRPEAHERIRELGRRLMYIGAVMATSRDLSEAYDANFAAEKMVEHAGCLLDEVPTRQLGWHGMTRKMPFVNDVVEKGQDLLRGFENHQVLAKGISNVTMQHLACFACGSLLNAEGACPGKKEVNDANDVEGR